jgi:hypothetical protein
MFYALQFLSHGIVWQFGTKKGLLLATLLLILAIAD